MNQLGGFEYIFECMKELQYLSCDNGLEVIIEST
jgi:hypothetical protein